MTDNLFFHFQDLGFEGALRFYFEDGKEELTKALRLTNKTLVSELLPTLIEKFKPDLVNSAVEKKAKLYEVYEEGKIYTETINTHILTIANKHCVLSSIFSIIIRLEIYNVH